MMLTSQSERSRAVSVHAGSLRRTLGVIIAVAVVLRLLVFFYIAHEPRKFYTYDSDGYDRRAVNLLNYGVFASEAQPPLTHDLDRTPVYPAFLAAIFAVAGHVPAAVALVQILLGSLTALLAWGLARELHLPERVGLIAALIVAIDPISIMTTNRLLTETLFTTLLVAGVFLIARYWRTAQLRWLLLSALMIALTALTRPIAQFLPVALLPLFALAARRAHLGAALARGLLFALLALGLTYTWAYHNYRQTGVFTLSTISDINLIYYRARAVLAAAEGTSQDEAWSKLQAQIRQAVAEQQLTPAQEVALQRQQALEIFKRYPGLTFMMLAKGVGRIFIDPGYTISCTLLDRASTAFDCFPGKSSMNEPGLFGKAFGKFGQMTVVQQLTLIWSALLLGAMYLGAVVGALRLIAERRWLALFLLLIAIGYFVALSAGAEANSRFRIPTVPFFGIFAGVGFIFLTDRYRAWQQARRQAVLLAEQI